MNGRSMFAAALALAGSACATNVHAPGVLGTANDPASGELWYVLEGLESGAVEMRALGFGDHDGAVIDLYTADDQLRWQACTMVVFDFADGGAPLEADVVRRDFEPERDVLGGLGYTERATVIIDDAALARAANVKGLDLFICGREMRLAGAELGSFVRFATQVLQAHEGKGPLYSPVVPSEE